MQQEGEFFDLDKADFGLVPVHCDVWAGFIFVNLDRDRACGSLREFLGPMVGALEDYPFDAMTERYVLRSEAPTNWKILLDALQEQYHAPIVHGNARSDDFDAPMMVTGFEAPALPDRRPAPHDDDARLPTVDHVGGQAQAHGDARRAAGCSVPGTRPTSARSPPASTPAGAIRGATPSS